MNRRVIVVGGGAAGFIAAGQAALNGAETILLEKTSRPGRKLSITGNGRCNLTNMMPLDQFIENYNSGGKFLRQAFARFFAEDLIEFFEKLGIKTKLENGRKVFPAGHDAKKIVKAFTAWAGRCGVEILTESPVESLIIDEGHIAGVQIDREKESYRNTNGRGVQKQLFADAVIIATGGLSYPGTGSTGDGYRLAESVGHKIIALRPSLVPIETNGDIAGRLQGLSLGDVNIKVCIDSRKQAQGRGEMLFTHFGLSGPVILSLSRMVVDAFQLQKKVTISIDLKPDLDKAELEKQILRMLDTHGKQKFGTLIKTLMPRKLIPVCCELTKIVPDKLAHQISSQERKSLCRFLKDFQFEVKGYHKYEDAIVTAGGVDTKEVNPRTMESLLVKGLYFAGEVLDIDGDTGGFNLQAAFSTGWLAGQSASKINE
jgi:predicted Rossmann fold flavoprotein